MIKILVRLIWLLIIAISLIWLFQNDGYIEIFWLGYLIKVSILSFFVAIILSIWLLIIFYRLLKFVTSLFIGVFGIFRKCELKKKSKEIKKYEDTFLLIKEYFKAININDIKLAKIKQKKITSLCGDKELKSILQNQIEKTQSL